MRKILSLLALLAPLAFGQDWTALTESFPSNYVMSTFTKNDFDSATRKHLLYHRDEGATWGASIYSNAVYACSVNVAASTLPCTKTFQGEWLSANNGSPYHTVMLAGNLSGDSTPPDRHAYYSTHGGNLYLFGGLHASSGIRDTISFDDADVNITDDEITLNRALKHFINREIILFLTAAPAPLSVGTPYFMIRTGPQTIKIATTSANAEAGTAVNLSGTATGSIYRAFAGSPFGDNAHPSDIWRLNTTSWVFTQLHPDPSYHRGTMAHGQATEYVPRVGSRSARIYIQRLRNYETQAEYPWYFDLEAGTMHELTSAGNARNANEAPNVQTASSMTYLDGPDVLVDFGDTQDSSDASGNGVGNDFFSLDPDSPTWTRETWSGPLPRKRRHHCVEGIRGTDQFIVAGGRIGSTNLRDTWLCDYSDKTCDSLEVTLFTNSTAAGHTYCSYDRKNGGILLQTSPTDAYFMEIGTADIVDNVAPVITDDPDNATENEGETATFTCAATGTPTPTWTWEKDGVTIGGATSSSYTTPTLTAADNGAAFTCIATNSEGSDESAPAVLTVLTPATVTDDPDDVTVTEPDPAEFECAAAGSPVISYQWQRNGSDIPGETNPWYILDPTELADDGDLFRCIVSNAAGADTSTAAELTVESALSAPVVTVNPAHDTVLAPAAGEFSCTATGNPTPTYQWQRDGVDIGGATSSTYTTPATVYGDDGAAFRCIVTNSEGADTSTAGILTVNAAPVITSDPQDRTVLVGASAGFGVGVTGSPTLTYQWQEDGSDIVGATSATYTIPSAAEADSGKAFRVIVTNSFGADTSGAAILHVVDEIRRAKVGPRRKAGIGPR